MAVEPHPVPGDPALDRHDSVEMPRPTVWPIVLSLGLLLVGLGVATNLAVSVTGAVLAVFGLAGWVAQMLPGRGHQHEPLPPPQQRPQMPAGTVGTVGQLGTGMPGYRLRLPVDMHPVSAGVWGGIAGGVLMPVPAVVWALLSGHTIWYPVNLLAGMVMPLEGRDLEQLSPGLLVLGIAIHAVMCLVIGLLYGVLMPTLPEIPRPIAWGGLLMPILWTAVSYVAMRIANPALPEKVDWPWFVLSQFVFGITMPAVVLAAGRWPAALGGVVGGLVGGAAMAVPAVYWAVASGHGFWYPINLVAGVVLSGPGNADAADLGRFHAEWFPAAAAMHAVLSVGFGVLFALVSRRLPPIPAPMAWGGLLMPLLWTGVSYALMGIVNPALERGVDWRWFIVSQFVFGVAAATVVVNSEKVHIPPAGSGRAA
jgi:hypothetical protein